MRGGLIISVAFHLLVLLALVVGLPFLDSGPKPIPAPIPVEVVHLSPESSTPKGAKPEPKTDRKPDPDADKSTTKQPVARDPNAGDKGKARKTTKAETPPKAKPPEKKPEPKPVKKAEAKPEKKPAPKPEKKAEPKPKPVEKAEVEPKPEPRTEPKPKPKAAPEKAEVAPRPAPEKKPEKKQVAEATPPKAKDDKKVAKKTEPEKTGPEKTGPEKTEPQKKRPRIAARPQFRPRTPRRVARETERKPKPKRHASRKRGEDRSMDSVFKTVNKFKRETRQEANVDRTRRPRPVGREDARDAKLTRDDLQAIAQQIRPCWNPPIGAPNPGRLFVALHIRLRPDGSLIDVRAAEPGRMQSDSYYRAAAEAAMRAIRDPACSPLKLPAAKYNLWKSMIFQFDPSALGSG